MYTTISVMESIPYSPVVVAAQFRSIRPSRRRFVQSASSQVLSRSRVATQFTHAQFTAHEEHPSS